MFTPPAASAPKVLVKVLLTIFSKPALPTPISPLLTTFVEKIYNSEGIGWLYC